ncbi:MAG: hypothetical protein R2849_01405 [Thermomicrobiales bacterium]
MQSQVHINRDQSLLTTVRRWLRPTGGAVVDGARLAVVNGIVLLAALILSFVLVLLIRLIRIVIPVPAASPGVIVLVLSVVFGLVVWYRYARSHRRLAQAAGKRVNPDRFGIIAGLPFALLALMLLGSGLFGLAISTIGLNVGGMGAALGRIVFSILFGLMAVASVAIARFAMRE